MRRREYDALIARHEARVDEPSYRLRVRAWMWLGTLTLLAGVLLVAGLAIGFVVLLLLGRAWLFLAKGVKLLFVAFVAVGAFVKSLWVRIDAPVGFELTREQDPQLFARLDEIARADDALLPDRVVLTGELNAAVASTRMWGPLPFYTHTLVLGLPLMDAIAPEEFDAIIGHEFGHLSRSDSAFGGRVYRTRLAWLRVQDHIEQHSVSAGALGSRFIAWYAPRFAALTHVLARRNEISADRAGAAIASAQTSVDALVRLHLASRRAEAELWGAMKRHVLEREHPPEAVYDELASIVRAASEDERAQQWLERALRQYTDSTDTHPSLSERAAALQATPRVPPPLRESASERYLGDSVPKLREALGDEWAEDSARWWQPARARLLEGQAEVEQLERQGLDSLTKEQCLELASHYMQVARRDEGRRMYQHCHERDPSDFESGFAYGRCLLSMDDDSGVALIHAAIAGQPSLALPGYVALSSFHRERGEREAALRADEALEDLVESHNAYHERLATLDKREVLSSPTLPAAQLEQLVRLLDNTSRVRKAWLAAREPTERGDHPHVLVIAVKVPFFGHSRGSYRRELAAAVGERLRPLGEPILVIARGEHGWLDKKLAAIEGARIYP